MLDVLHYLFEEDATYDYTEQVEHKSSMRKVVYKTLYNTDYAYSATVRDSSPNSFNGDDSGVDTEVFNSSMNREVKPYMPPTNFNPDSPNPFQGTLREAPLG